ncbi:MAG: hypothetical protein Q4A40_02485 [Bacillota bacterium]|nr:hypothetical protein [Bacillota bacterium]
MKEYVDAKCSVFTEYMQIPEELQGEFDSLCSEMHALGDKCTDYYQFEEMFVSSGLSDRYNELLTKCTPRAVKMTSEQKKAAVRMTKEQISVGDIVRDAAGIAVSELQQEAISMRRKKMIEDEVFDDYARTTNRIDDAARAGKFIFNKFRKK